MEYTYGSANFKNYEKKINLGYYLGVAQIE